LLWVNKFQRQMLTKTVSKFRGIKMTCLCSHQKAMVPVMTAQVEAKSPIQRPRNKLPGNRII